MINNENLEKLLEGKIEFFSALSRVYNSFEDAREELCQLMLDDLTDLAKILPSSSGGDPAQSGSQSDLPRTAFALVMEAAAEFSVRIYRTRGSAEDAERKFREGHQELIEYGEISSDVIDISDIVNDLRSSLNPPKILYFRVYVSGDDFQILLNSSEAGLASLREDFEIRHGDHLSDYLVGTGIAFLPQSP